MALKRNVGLCKKVINNGFFVLIITKRVHFYKAILLFTMEPAVIWYMTPKLEPPLKRNYVWAQTARFSRRFVIKKN